MSLARSGRHRKDSNGPRREQSDPGRKPRQRPRHEVHPGRHGHLHPVAGHDLGAQGQGRQHPGAHRVAPGEAVREAGRDRRRVPAQGPPGLHRRLDPLRQVHRPGRGREVLHRHHRRRDADARRWRRGRRPARRAPGSPAAAQRPGPAARGPACVEGRFRRGLRRRRHPVLSTAGAVQTWLVTGGAGFIGGNFVLEAVAARQRVVNLDALTYAGNLDTLSSLKGNDNHVFVHGDIGDRALVDALLREHRPDAILNFAAESHVDRSIDGPGAFVQTNVVGTLALLEAARDYWRSLEGTAREAFRFLHVSTDEVYGSLGETGRFTETTPYAPNSPYSASKAASDHLVRAFHHTYGLPVLTTNCSNNYGPYRFPEKLIPLVIAKAIAGEPLPIYGDGKNVRDWLYVMDLCSAIRRVLVACRVIEGSYDGVYFVRLTLNADDYIGSLL